LYGGAPRFATTAGHVLIHGGAHVIIEGIVTTLDEDGSAHITPMGPTVDAAWQRLILRPYTSSHTLRNLERNGQGVFHVTDDVELIARAAIDQLSDMPATRPASSVHGVVLTDACRWYSFQVESEGERQQRAVLHCRILNSGFQREFSGFCRAKHAVVEAAILATRVRWLESAHLREELGRLEPLVEKTGGESEKRAFELLQRFILSTG